MPPFREGINKRKLSPALSNNTSKNSTEKEVNIEDDLFVGNIAEDKNDSTDSEHESDPEVDSDNAQEGVLFGDDADSTLEGGEPSEDGSNDSSELEDSEGGDESENDSEEESPDSGAETGETQTGDSGGEPPTHPSLRDKNKQKKVKTKQQLKDSVDRLANKIKETNVSTQPVSQRDEYSSGDTSDEEDRRTTVGAVPRHWYDEYPHLGYDLDGRRVLKPPQRDAIDSFLKQCEDPEFWRTVKDPQTGQDVILAKQDLELLARIRAGQVPNPDHDEYQPWVEWFSREVLATPVRAFPEHKRSFLPSREEQRAIGRIVHALRMGWAKTRKQLAEERRKRKEKKYYDLWGASAATDEEQRAGGVHRHIPAPRRPPPSHAESYNPPPEYLLDDKEMKEWDKLAETPWKRKYTFLPTRHSSLRAVPAYSRFVRERFLRCLDLYLAPRAIKMRLTIRPEDLVPSLPSPRDLQPFPTREVLRLTGHASAVRTCDFDPTGQYIVSGSDDATVKIWETATGRCLRTIAVEEAVSQVVWCPARGLSLVAAASGRRLLLLNPGADIGAHATAALTDQVLDEPPPQHDVAVDERTARAAQWERVRPEQWARGVRIVVSHFNPLAHISWHGRGDYVAATVRDGGARAVLVHQVSRRRSQLPLARAKGLVQCAVFHPHRPQLFVATQRVVRIYDLVKQQLVKKLLTGAQWVSTMAVHPGGDNLLVASYDRKCMWFDLELSSQPYQTLRLHGRAVRAVAFSSRYPLFATGGDDPYLVVSHATVYNDLLQNPLLVPLKQLNVMAGREPCVLGLRWHPAQPWLLAAAADSTLRLYA